MQKAMSTKATFTTTKRMVSVVILILMVHVMKALGLPTFRMARGQNIGMMVRNTLEGIGRGRNTAMVCICGRIAPATKATGKKIKLRVSVHTLGRTGVDTQATGRIAICMGKESMSGLMGDVMRADMLRTRSRGTECTGGQMDADTRATG